MWCLASQLVLSPFMLASQLGEWMWVQQTPTTPLGQWMWVQVQQTPPTPGPKPVGIQPSGWKEHWDEAWAQAAQVSGGDVCHF